MPASPLRTEGWLHFLTSDAQVVGVVTWAGLLVTIAGFGIALAQIHKVKRSSQAASEAVAGLVKVVRSHEQNAYISSAFGHLTSAQTMIKQGNSDAAAAYLSVGWTALMSARELSDETAERRLIEGFVLATRELLDDVGAPSAGSSSRAAGRRNADINKLLSGLGSLSVKLHSALSGIGSAP